MCCTFTLAFIYILIKQGALLKSYTDELSLVIAQAQEVKQDLIELMDDALGLSKTLVDELDAKMAQPPNCKDTLINDDSAKQVEEEYPSKVVKFNPASTSRIRVYDLARELHISSRELVSMLQSRGLNITSHMNLIDYEQAKQLIDSQASGNEDQLPSNQTSEEDYINELRSAHPYLAVRSLYEKGYPVWQIAKILGRGQGEVNLILNLTNKKAGSI